MLGTPLLTSNEPPVFWTKTFQGVTPCSNPGLSRRFTPQVADGVADAVDDVVEELSTLEVLDTSDDVLVTVLEVVDTVEVELELSVELEDNVDEVELETSVELVTDVDVEDEVLE